MVNVVSYGTAVAFGAGLFPDRLPGLSTSSKMPF